CWVAGGRGRLRARRSCSESAPGARRQEERRKAAVLGRSRAAKARERSKAATRRLNSASRESRRPRSSIRSWARARAGRPVTCWCRRAWRALVRRELGGESVAAVLMGTSVRHATPRGGGVKAGLVKKHLNKRS